MAKFYNKIEVSIVAERKDKEWVSVKMPKKTMETQNKLRKTAVELARLDHRANITKAENLRRPEREDSVRKQHRSFATVQKRKPRSSSPSVNNKNIEHLN